MNREEIENIATEVVDAGFKVHKALGPGLLESAYQKCLVYELISRGLEIEVEKPVPVTYNEINIDCGYRLDIVVENQIILELKAVEELSSLHFAQILTHMKLSDIRLGFLMNFNVRLFKSGIKRVVHNY